MICVGTELSFCCVRLLGGASVAAGENWFYPGIRSERLVIAKSES